MIIDTHMHTPQGLSLSAAGYIEILDRFGIDIGLISGWEVMNCNAPAGPCNDALVDYCRQTDGRLLPMATVHLSHGDRAVDEVRRCIEVHNVAGFKLHPWLQGETIFCDAMFAMAELAGQHNKPIMYHDGTPAYAMSSQVGLLALACPETTFVLGHGGILHFWREAMDYTVRCSNLYITLCGGHPFGFDTICRTVPTDRILWGSDYLGPGSEELLTYRKDMMKTDTLSLDAALYDAVMGTNAARLYGLNSP